MAASNTKEILADLSPFIKLYSDGSVDRLFTSPYVPPSLSCPKTGVSTKDTLSPNPPSRLFLPNPSDRKLPIILYFHGGGFCTGSAFSLIDQLYMKVLSAESNALVISVDYRLAPEHPLPAAYVDAWNALEWVCSHVLDKTHVEKEPWIAEHGDMSRIYVAGDSSGANIAHNVAMRAGSEPLPGNVKISGVILSHPYFWGSDPVGGEGESKEEEHLFYKISVRAAYPNAEGGIDNPIADGAPSLSGVGCEKMLVCVSEEDLLKDWGCAYVERLRKSGWRGEVEIVEVEGEDHCFHVFDPRVEKAKNLIKCMASFVNSSP